MFPSICVHFLKDPYSATELQQLKEKALNDLMRIEGLPRQGAEILLAHGWRSTKEVTDTQPEILARIPGIGSIDVGSALKAAAQAAMNENKR